MIYGIICCRQIKGGFSEVERHNVAGVMPAFLMAQWYREQGWEVVVLPELRREAGTQTEVRR